MRLSLLQTGSSYAEAQQIPFARGRECISKVIAATILARAHLLEPAVPEGRHLGYRSLNN